MTARVDWPHLLRLLDAAQEIRGGLTDRAAAEQIGIAPSTLSRLRRGKTLTADGLAALVAWLTPTRLPSWITTEETPTP